MRALPDAAIDSIIECAGRNPSTAKLFWFDHYHGAMCRIAQEASAFAVREPGYGFLVRSEWRDPREAPRQIRWVEGAIEAMRPFSAEVCYVANLGDEPPDRIRACYGPNYGRLVALKKNYDPDNFFRLNQNIPPTSAISSLASTLVPSPGRLIYILETPGIRHRNCENAGLSNPVCRL